MIPPEVQRRASRYLREVLAPATGQDLVTHWARRTQEGWVFGVASRAFADAGEGPVLAPILVPDEGDPRPAG